MENLRGGKISDCNGLAVLVTQEGHRLFGCIGKVEKVHPLGGGIVAVSLFLGERESIDIPVGVYSRGEAYYVFQDEKGAQLDREFERGPCGLKNAYLKINPRKSEGEFVDVMRHIFRDAYPDRL